MPKEATVCVLDVGRTMCEASGSGETRLASAIKAVEMLFQQKLMFKPKDEMALVLLGTEETANDLAESEGGYANVVSKFDLQETSLEMLQSLSTIAPSKDVGDLLDGLVVGLTLLHNHTKGKKGYERRVLLITDAANPVADTDQLDAILKFFSGMSCTLDIIGVEFGDTGVPKAALKAANEAMLKDMAKSVGGNVLPTDSAIALMSRVRSRSIQATTKFRGNLDIGGVVTIPVHAYAKVAQEKPPSLKKESKAVDGGAKVTMDRQYRSTADPTTEVPKEDRVKAFPYGKERYPLSDADIASMKLPSERELAVLGFCQRSQVPRHHYMAGVDVLVPEPGSGQGKLGLSAVIHALHDTDRVGIARYVKRKNTAPELVVLTPSIVSTVAGAAAASEEESAMFECLYVNKLPFVEDLRSYRFAPFDAVAPEPTTAQLEAAGGIVDSLNLMTAVVRDDGSTDEALKPSEVFNPHLQHLYASIQQRAKAPGCALPPVDPALMATLKPMGPLFAKAEPELRRAAAAFPIKKSEKAASKKRKYWGDDGDAAAAPMAVAAAGAGASAAAADLAKNDSVDVAKPKKRQHTDVTVDDLFQSNVKEVGSSDPVGNFEAMLKRRDEDLVEAAVQGMQHQIDRLVDAGASYNGKAIDCLVALRKGCLSGYMEESFNDFLHALKAKASGSEFWKAFAASGVKLITEDEAGVSVTQEEATEFFKVEDVAPVPVMAAPVAALDDDDDLDDMD